MPKLRPYDEALLRQSFAVAKRSREGGDHPFGSVLADRDGKVLREQGNGYSSEGGDRTAHAERLLASWAAKTLSLEELKDCTIILSRYGVMEQFSGTVAVIGPTRMPYGRNVAAVRYVADLMSGLVYDYYLERLPEGTPVNEEVNIRE